MVFAIMAENEKAMAPVIEGAFGVRRRLKFGPGQWFVSMPGLATTEDVWERLDLGDDPSDEYTSAIIPVTAFGGWAEPRVWEWLSSRMSK